MRQVSRTRENDPLEYMLPLRVEAEYFPMGFPLQISTNFQPALDPAALMWSRFPKLFDQPAMRLKIAVSSDSTNALPAGTPILRGQEHLLSIVADRANFATADLDTGFAHIRVSREVASDPAYFRYHFLEPMAYVLIAARHIAFVHASCIALDGRAVLLSGASGMGKTCLAYACARRGWTFLSGDAVAVANAGRSHRIVGRPFEIRFRHTAARLFPELAGFPRALRPNGKTDIEADPKALNMKSAVEGTASRLVFLDRGLDRADQVATVSLQPLSSEEARRELEQGILFGDHSVRERQGQTLDRLAQLPAARLRYSDLDTAELALREFVGTGA